MPQQVSKKAENIKAETKKLEDITKKKVQAIDKAEKAGEENTKNEIQQMNSELEKFKKKTNDVLSGKVEDTGWDEQAVQVGERMKQLIEQEAHLQHSLLLKTDEATAELELKAKTIRKELPLVSDFSEEDRVQILTGIDKSIHKLKERRQMIEAVESKLNRQMQVLMEYTPDPAEDKETILRKLQMAYDVVSGANDPDRARDHLLKMLNPTLLRSDEDQMCGKKPACPKPHISSGHSPVHPPNALQGDRVVRPSNPAIPPNQGGISRPSNHGLPPTAVTANTGKLQSQVVPNSTTAPLSPVVSPSHTPPQATTPASKPPNAAKPK